MATIFTHEIAAYREELAALAERFDELCPVNSDVNITHASLAASNRAALLVVGLCSLVESRMFELTESHPARFKLADLNGQGVSKLKTYLDRVGAVDFERLKSWERFMSIYKIRNFIVHSYGGLVESGSVLKVEAALKRLDLEDCLVGGRRLRIGPKTVESFVAVVEDLLGEFGAFAT